MEGSLHIECDQRRASAGTPTGSDRRHRQRVEVEAIVWDDTGERARIEETLRRRGLKVVAFRTAQEGGAYELIAIEAH